MNATNGTETLITTTLPPPPVQTVIETEIELSVENATSLDVKSIAAVAQEIVAQTSGVVEDVETDVTVSFEVKASVTLKGLTSEQFETNKDGITRSIASTLAVKPSQIKDVVQMPSKSRREMLQTTSSGVDVGYTVVGIASGDEADKLATGP